MAEVFDKHIHYADLDLDSFLSISPGAHSFDGWRWGKYDFDFSIIQPQLHDLSLPFAHHELCISYGSLHLQLWPLLPSLLNWTLLQQGLITDQSLNL